MRQNLYWVYCIGNKVCNVINLVSLFNLVKQDKLCHNYFLACYLSSQSVHHNCHILTHFKEDMISQNAHNVYNVWKSLFDLGPYSPTILKNILNLFLQIFVYFEAFKWNTTSDWLNRTV